MSALSQSTSNVNVDKDREPQTAYNSNKQIQVMVDMIDGNFPIDNETKVYMAAVRGICAQAARELSGLATCGVKLDQGQLNAAIQLLQQVKNKACDAASIGFESNRRAASQPKPPTQ